MPRSIHMSLPLLLVASLAATLLSRDDDPTSSPAGRLSAGEIPLRDFLRFIHETTGRLVNFPGEDPAFAEDINLRVLSDIDQFTFPLAEAILGLNGYLVTERRLAGGQRMYEASALASRLKNKQPRPSPVVGRARDLGKIKDREVGTLVHPLEHADSGEVVAVLRDLLDVDSDSGIKIVSVPQSRTVILRAPARVLRHTAILLEYIDVEPLEARSILKIYTLEHADAQDLVDLIAQALEAFSGRSLNEPRRRSAGGGAAATPRAQRSRRRPESDPTSIIPDPRTHKLIVQSTSENEIDLVDLLIEQLDVRYTGGWKYTRVYEVKYHRASSMAETLQAWIQGTDFAERFRVVAHDPSNTIIIRAIDQRYGAVLNQLIELDTPRLVAAENSSSRLHLAPYEFRTYRIRGKDGREQTDRLREQWKSEPRVRARFHAPSRSLIVRAPSELLGQIEEWLEKRGIETDNPKR